jgi:hypothetical protein
MIRIYYHIHKSQQLQLTSHRCVTKRDLEQNWNKIKPLDKEASLKQ